MSLEPVRTVGVCRVYPVLYRNGNHPARISRGPTVKTRACHSPDTETDARNPGSTPGEGDFGSSGGGGITRLYPVTVARIPIPRSTQYGTFKTWSRFQSDIK